MFVELHIIQNFAPANLNRDDTNSPKDCEFGGVRRARISSQCLKRAMREAPVFAATTRADNGVRTRWLARKVKGALVDAGKAPAEAAVVANTFAAEYSGKTESVKESDVDRTAVLIYLSPEELQAAGAGLLAGWEAALAASASPEDKAAQKASPVPALVKNLVKASQGRTSAPDIALFGRMLADNPRLNLPAACQVAHAISTHRVAMDLDFYTAVDEAAESEETGAGMMGVTGFNSACFYRYARVDVDLLRQNLDGDPELAERTLEGFLRAAVAAVPKGKQNSSAAHNPPSFLLAVVRRDGQGWSLANAFERPVTAGREGGLVGRSVEKLARYYASLRRTYGEGGVPVALVLDAGLDLGPLGEATVESMEEWVAAVKAAMGGQ